MSDRDDWDPIKRPRAKTVVRKPGGGTQVPDNPSPSPPPGRPLDRPEPSERPHRPDRPGRADVIPGALAEFLARGHNPIVSAAAPLMVLGTRLRETMQMPADLAGLRRQAMQEVRAFEQRAREAGVAEDDAGAARYVLCTFLDLAVFATPWATQSHWAAQSLLAAVEGEAFGGQKFFELLEALLKSPDRYRDLIELQYLCLALGMDPGPAAGRIDERDRRDFEARALEIVRQRRSDGGRPLSPHWEGVRSQRNPVRDLVPWWMAALVGLVVVFGGFLYWRAQLAAQVRPVKVALAADTLPMSYEAAAPTVAMRLKTLLAPQEQAGLLSVEELGDRELVTLNAPGLFASGSASVDTAFVPVLEAIGDAAAEVGGQLIVVGHTDDQPIRSFRFQDNFELSRARARSVAELLQARIGAGAWIEWKGVGDTQPRYQPVSTPENRGRNRRVEIVQLPEVGER